MRPERQANMLIDNSENNYLYRFFSACFDCFGKNESEKHTGDYSFKTLMYINSFTKRVPYSEILNEDQLSADLRKEIENFCDPISFEIMDIPVQLNGRCYNLSTLLEIHENGSSQDPFTREKFDLCHILPATKMNEDIMDFISRYCFDIEDPNPGMKI